RYLRCLELRESRYSVLWDFINNKEQIDGGEFIKVTDYEREKRK
ncbi:18814_t:CDS:1, partial [Gigaspora rosea]